MASSALMLSLLFVAAVCGVCGAAASAALDEVCGLLGGHYVTPELCLSALCHDASSPCGAARDAPAVAALAARLTAANATVARDSVRAALSSSAAAANATAAAGLRSCLQLYGGIVPALQWAAGSVAAGRYRGAEEVVQAAQYITSGCEGMAGAALPREKNSGFFMMAFVTHAVLQFVSRLH